MQLRRVTHVRLSQETGFTEEYATSMPFFKHFGLKTRMDIA
jgi:hypothetical protein